MNDTAYTAALVAALHAQTEAINRLADSNQQVIDYLLAQEAEGLGDDGNAPSGYLDPDEE
tara:strand:+ start:200 stop:379 length:180 start_codon:yes stop_codon:yes gene_type:complete